MSGLVPLVFQNRIAFAGKLRGDFVGTTRGGKTRAGLADVVEPFLGNSRRRLAGFDGSSGIQSVQFGYNALGNLHDLLDGLRRQLGAGLLHVKLQGLGNEVFFVFR